MTDIKSCLVYYDEWEGSIQADALWNAYRETGIICYGPVRHFWRLVEDKMGPQYGTQNCRWLYKPEVAAWLVWSVEP